jgi:hypothetical protein
VILTIEYESLAAAHERGPGDLFERCKADRLRLLEQPTYLEQDGRGVLSALVADPPALPPDESSADVIAADNTAPSEAADKETDQ